MNSAMNKDTTTAPTSHPQLQIDDADIPPLANVGSISSTSDLLSIASPTPLNSTAPGAKRVRTSKPKVRTGCSSCKQRRIKCDEKRPSCTQCVRSSKACTGYPPPSRVFWSYEAATLAPKQSPSTEDGPNLDPVAPPSWPLRKVTALPPRRMVRPARARVSRTHKKQECEVHFPLAQQPFDGIPFKGADGLYFRLFRAHTGSGLSGYFDSVFWTKMVPQQSHATPAIRSAVLALGALYKTLEQPQVPSMANTRALDIPTTPTIPTTDPPANHLQAAIAHYSGACNASIALDNNDNSSSHRIRLMATILLVCFDSLIGDYRQAIRQIQIGLKLLEPTQVAQGQEQDFNPKPKVEDELLIMFNRLAVQAKSYQMAFHFPEPLVVRLAPNTPSLALGVGRGTRPGDPILLPHHFLSLREARLASDKLSEGMMRFLDELSMLQSRTGNPEPERHHHGLLSKPCEHYVSSFKDQLRSWSNAFEPIFSSRHEEQIQVLEKVGLAVLKMYQLNVQILFSMTFSKTEEQYDAFLPQFQTIVRLAEEVMSSPNATPVTPSLMIDPGGAYFGQYCDSLAAQQPITVFSADLAIVPPLFVVATKCRDRTLRRQAIQLLRSSPRREGMWDSELASHIAEWVMELEEYPGGSMATTATSNLTGTSGVSSTNHPDHEKHDDLADAAQAAQLKTLIPEERRCRITSVDFDLRARQAHVQVGSRNADPNLGDPLFREKRITW